MRLNIVHHPAYVATLPDGHRFPMDKYGRLFHVLCDDGLAVTDNCHAPEPAPRHWIKLVHDADYVDGILDLTASNATMRQIGLPLNDTVARRSRCAVAGTVLTGRLALRHGIACNTAGGSHHAASTHGAGFCVFNDVAIAARLLQAEEGLARILVIDLDVHQGDGTAEIFHGDESVFTFSMHCDKNFPARKQTSDLDVGLAEGAGDAVYLQLLAMHLFEVIRRTQPELVFYNAGVDPHMDDRLGKLMLSDDGLARRDTMVLRACLDASVPVACAIGGGYAADGAASARRHTIVHRAAADLIDTNS